MDTLPHDVKLSDWANLRLVLLWAYVGSPVQTHRHAGMTPGATAWLLQSGRVHIQIGTNAWSAHAGQWVLIPQGGLRFDFSDDARILSIHYIAHWLSGRPLFEHDTPLVLPADDHPDLTKAGWALQRFVHRRYPDAATHLVHQPTDVTTHLQLQILTQRWMLAVVAAMAAMDRQPTPMHPMDSRVVEARRLIDSLTASEPFVERALPQRLGISASHLDRLFVTELGVTPRDYAERCRVSWAQHRLATSDDPVKLIAMQLGFRQPSHFTHWFHKHTGSSPNEYRRTVSGAETAQHR